MFASKGRISTTAEDDDTAQESRQRTRDFQVDADAPVRGALGAVDIQVPQPNLAHALGDDAGFLLARDANLIPVVRVLRGVEGVDEVEVAVPEGACWVRGLRGGGFEVV